MTQPKQILLIGGGGPTGPLVVNSLIADGHQVTVMNTGRHPVKFNGPVEQITADPNSLANAVGLILEKDISNDAQFVEHLLTNFGVTSSLSIYLEAKNALTNLKSII